MTQRLAYFTFLLPSIFLRTARRSLTGEEREKGVLIRFRRMTWTFVLLLGYDLMGSRLLGAVT
jgi:hypothetical protein